MKKGNRTEIGNILKLIALRGTDKNGYFYALPNELDELWEFVEQDGNKNVIEKAIECYYKVWHRIIKWSEK